MWIIVDERMPLQAKKALRNIGDVIEFPPVKGVYPPVASHPDIFVTELPGYYVLAPNVPFSIQQLFKMHSVPFSVGKRLVGCLHPETAGYNVVASEACLLCHPELTEEGILEMYRHKQIIPVRQAYTRCSTIALNNDCYITSDSPIFRSLQAYGKKVLLVSAEGIQLPGLSYGLFGGCCGMYNGVLYLSGSLDYYVDGERCRQFLAALRIAYVELYNGPLFDGGGVFFIQNM